MHLDELSRRYNDLLQQKANAEYGIGRAEKQLETLRLNLAKLDGQLELLEELAKNEQPIKTPEDEERLTEAEVKRRERRAKRLAEEEEAAGRRPLAAGEKPKAVSGPAASSQQLAAKNNGVVIPDPEPEEESGLNILGLHDIGGQSWMADDPGWLVESTAIRCDPNDRSGVDYRPLFSAGLGMIVRLNNAHNGVDGTLPDPSRYGDFARRCAHFVAASPGCTRWIVGNEPQHANELPNGQPILPLDYADCYRQCRAAIHGVPGHERDEVIVAPVAPWDATCKYAGNPHGDWLQYMAEVLVVLLDTGCDGLCVHSYVHGNDPALIHSTAKMRWPFEDRYFNFLAYQDTLGAIPKALRHLPVYLTEFDNCDGPWLDTNDGLIQAMIMEVDSWNRQTGTQAIHCAVCYRWSGDQWALEGKQQRLADFAAALALGISSPGLTPPVDPSTPPTRPPVEPPAPEPEPDRDIDAALIARGVNFDFAVVPAGTGYWRLIHAQWLDEAGADAVGPDHHILGKVQRDGREVAGVPLLVRWPLGETIIVSKSDQANTRYNYDHPMTASLNEFSIRVSDGNPSDSVSGIGMGKDGNPSVHTSTWLDWEWVIAESVQPGPEPPLELPEPAPTIELVHPLPNSVITQNFYEESDAYEQYGFRAHNGTDLGGRPLRTPVRSLASGIVAYSDFDPGYGHYCRLDYRDLDCYVMFCHLDEPGAPAGAMLQAGDTVGLLGTSGNSTGVHLHIEVRLQNKDGTYREDTPMSKGRVDPRTWCCLHNLKL